MNNNEDLFEKLSREYTPEELAESFVFPHGMSEEEKQRADAELWALRQNRLENRTPTEKIYAGLLSLKYQLKACIKQPDFDPLKGVSHFLRTYLKVLQQTQKQLAEDIAIHPARLSRILRGKEKLSLAIAYRLEAHAGEVIPALYWWKLVQKEVEQEIRTDDRGRLQERKKVKKVGYKRVS